MREPEMEEEITSMLELPTEEVTEIVYTENPQTTFKQKRKKLIIDTKSANSVISELKLFRGEEAVSVDPMDMISDPYRVTVKTQYLLPGEYYLYIETADFEEYLPFTIK